MSEYMQQLLDDDEDAYKRQFGRFVKLGITPDEVRAHTGLLKMLSEMIVLLGNRSLDVMLINWSYITVKKGN